MVEADRMTTHPERAIAHEAFVIRCEGVRVAGWQVRLPHWHPQGPASKLFSDSKHGGPNGAKERAISYRDRMFAGLPPARISYKKSVHHRQSNNESGLIGVAFQHLHCPGRNGQTDDPDTGHLYWIAYWKEPGHPRQAVRRFPVAKLGFIKAWEAAVEIRQQKTGDTFSPHELASGRLYCLTVWGRLMSKGILYPA